MAYENFLWGAPRIHGELLMLGFSASPGHRVALPAGTRQTADTVVSDTFRNQINAFADSGCSESDRRDTLVRIFGPA
jgi:hypothetical protein